MKTYFSTKPELSFNCECYHMEESTTDNESGTNTIYVRAVTYRESVSFPYYSAKRC